MSLINTLNIARSGIAAQQAAMRTTGNNIANVNTVGYSRQRTVLDALNTGGVGIAGTERLRDQFLDVRLRDSNARLGARQTLAANLKQLEATLGDSTENGLSPVLREFFSAWQDLSVKPGGTTERESVRQQGNQLIANFQSVTGQLGQLREGLDHQIEQQVGRVNELAGQIAELNAKISANPQGLETQQSPEINGLLDRRDELVTELSSIVPLRVLNGTNGNLTLFAGGELLLEGSRTRTMLTVPNNANGGLLEVAMADVTGQPVALAGKLTEGSLGALIKARDGYAREAMAQTDRLAATLVRDVNAAHRAGTGLDGVSGRDFFTGLSVTAAPQWSNGGSAAVTATAVLNPAQLTFDDYEVRFTTAGQYEIIDTTTNVTVTPATAYVPGANIDFAGMRVVLNGAPAAGDVIKVNSYEGASQKIALANGVAGDLDALAAGLSAAPGDNRNALALVALGTAGQMGGSTYEQFNDEVRLSIASASAAVQQGEADESITQQQVLSLVESASGVSLDEEATNIIQFQRAFEASSRIVSATDDMLQSLLQMI